MSMRNGSGMKPESAEQKRAHDTELVAVGVIILVVVVAIIAFVVYRNIHAGSWDGFCDTLKTASIRAQCRRGPNG